MAHKTPINLTPEAYRAWHEDYIDEVGGHCFTPLPNAILRRPNRRPSRWMPRLSWLGVWR